MAETGISGTAPWLLTDIPSVRGLHPLTLKHAYIGNEKDLTRIEQAKNVVHDACLIGGNPVKENPEVLREGLMLYRHLFPHNDEREADHLIVERLSEKTRRRSRRSCFDVLICRDTLGRVIAWHQFSTMPLGTDRALAFMQYTGSADEAYMRKHFGEDRTFNGHGIYTYATALMMQIADENALRFMAKPRGVAGYVLESEFTGQAQTVLDIQWTKRRLMIHEHTGAKAILLRMKDGTLRSPHWQPRLGVEADPIRLLMLYRPRTYDTSVIGQEESIRLDEARSLLLSFIGNFHSEGFPTPDVEEATVNILKIFDDADSAVLMPPSRVPDIGVMAEHDPSLRELIEKDFGPLKEHAALIREALMK